MVVNFDVPDKFNPSKNFTKVKFGEDAPLLEVELNELQEIQEHFRKVIVKTIFGNEDGMISGELTLNGEVLSIKDATFVYDGNIVEGGDLELNVTEGDKVYLSVWEREITSKSTIVKDGNVNVGETVPNDLLDNRIGEETSRRLQLLFELTTDNTSETKGYIELGEVTAEGFNSSVKGISSGGNKVIQPLPADAPITDIPLGTSTFTVDAFNKDYPQPNSTVITNKVDDNFVHQTVYAVVEGDLKQYERVYTNGIFTEWKEIADLAGITVIEENLTQKVADFEETITKSLITATESYNEYSLARDTNGVYTIAEIRRKSDDSVYQRSTLSVKDTRGNYTKQVVEFFKLDGVTLAKREEFSRMYDSEGTLTQKKLISEEVY